jgi:SAM-dependent methyltransferase
MTAAALPFSPAAERNKDPILQVLRTVLPERAAVLEIAAGTGQHAAHFAAASPGWTWLPTDADDAGLAAIAARCAPLPNVRPPLRVDLLAPWPATLGSFDAVYCANMIHISPWATCPALMRLAAQHLGPGGLLVLYGPYFVDGEPAAPGNLAFDAALRAQDANWGVRRLADVEREARQAGLTPDRRVAMPANNLCLVFRRAP